ncbi:hypothetical protein [Methanococcus maripaludis]|uniref:Uncharacterized protein n=1 Tax=Methanococcus maripaludis TaxID=39152 RepID=A0A7J9S4F8_METMI|nr:hypothetical protein [Methanococcus maripaludis]MBB6067552.1 hypothetical protein [Methanococcus maripaludis]
MASEEKNKKKDTVQADPYEGEPETQIQVVKMGKERNEKKDKP